MFIPSFPVMSAPLKASFLMDQHTWLNICKHLPSKEHVRAICVLRLFDILIHFMFYRISFVCLYKLLHWLSTVACGMDLVYFYFCYRWMKPKPKQLSAIMMEMAFLEEITCVFLFKTESSSHIHQHWNTTNMINILFLTYTLNTRYEGWSRSFETPLISL